MDLFDCSRDNDPSQRYVCNIVDLRSRYIVAAAPLDTKSAHGVLWVVSARGVLRCGCCECHYGPARQRVHVGAMLQQLRQRAYGQLLDPALPSCQ